MIKENIPLEPEEIIRPILGYEGLYSITSHGRVWKHARYRKFRNTQRLKMGEFLKQGTNKYGFLYVTLRLNSKVTQEDENGISSKLLGKQMKWLIYILLEMQFFTTNRLDLYKNKSYKNNNKLGILLKILKKCEEGHCTIEEDQEKNWHADIEVNKEVIHIGSYRTDLDAARAYNDYIREHKLNNPLNENIGE
jgi:hypothetical protein